jgi:hypothetical protein
MIRFILIPFVILMITFQSCSTTSPNVHTIVTNDCWNKYRLVKPGDFKPKLRRTCDKQVVLPAYQMPGSVEVMARFEGDAKAKITVDYLYEIKNPMVFVSQAKFILQSGLDDEDDYSVPNNQLELAENTITDKLLKDIIRDSLSNISIMEFDESKFESILQIASNKMCISRGVSLSAISLKIEYGKQTEEAIDALSAKGMYESADEKELGDAIIKAKAGKPEINIQVVSPETKKDE